MAYQMVATVVTLKVVHRLQMFWNAIRRTFVWHFTRFQLTVCWHGSSALAELLVLLYWSNVDTIHLVIIVIIIYRYQSSSVDTPVKPFKKSIYALD